MGNGEHLGEDGISIPIRNEKKEKKLVFRIPSLYFLVTSVHKRNRGFGSLPTFPNCAPNFTRPISPIQSHPPNLTQSQCSQPSAPTLPTLATVPTPDPTFTTWQCFDSSSTTLPDGDVLRTTSLTNCWQRHLCISCRKNKVALQKLKTEVPHPIQQEKKRKEKKRKEKKRKKRKEKKRKEKKSKSM